MTKIYNYVYNWNPNTQIGLSHQSLSQLQWKENGCKMLFEVMFQ